MYQEQRDYNDATENSCELAAILEFAGWEFVVNELCGIAARLYDDELLEDALTGLLEQARRADRWVAELAVESQRRRRGAANSPFDISRHPSESRDE